MSTVQAPAGAISLPLSCLELTTPLPLCSAPSLLLLAPPRRQLGGGIEDGVGRRERQAEKEKGRADEGGWRTAGSGQSTALAASRLAPPAAAYEAKANAAGLLPSQIAALGQTTPLAPLRTASTTGVPTAGSRQRYVSSSRTPGRAEQGSRSDGQLPCRSRSAFLSFSSPTRQN